MSGIFGAQLAPTPAWIDPKYPQEIRDFTFQVPAALIPQPANIVALTAEAAPSGNGQLTLNTLDLAIGTVTLNESAGQPGLAYTLRLTASLADGEVIQWLQQQQVLAYLPSDTATAATALGFGPAVGWAAGLYLAQIYAAGVI